MIAFMIQYPENGDDFKKVEGNGKALNRPYPKEITLTDWVSPNQYAALAGEDSQGTRRRAKKKRMATASDDSEQNMYIDPLIRNCSSLECNLE